MSLQWSGKEVSHELLQVILIRSAFHMESPLAEASNKDCLGTESFYKVRTCSTFSQVDVVIRNSEPGPECCVCVCLCV